MAGAAKGGAQERGGGSAVDRFITRWSSANGSERANYQLFLTELCALLDLPQPDPARDDTRDNAYVFERRVIFQHGDGTESGGYADLYRRGAFVLEAKRIRKTEGKSFDTAMLSARAQAEQYARALPALEGRPPFVVVVDVGSAIELYSEFTRSGATYTPFPDPRSHRIRLEDLKDQDCRERLRQVWIDPMALDPTRRTARVTREVAERLAEAAKALELTGHAPSDVAEFLSRCLFSMFAEDVGLLPKRSFGDLLEKFKDRPDVLGRMLHELWTAMDAGHFSAALATDVLRFNGKLFKDPQVLPLTRQLIDLLLDASRTNWRDVEPAIFGTLLERSLDPEERAALGAQYTPRAYVERLVMPAVIEPLRDDWRNVQGAALLLAGEGKMDEARAVVRSFLKSLTEIRVLDPACGSGNFLYVTLEHLKRLEGEVLNQLDGLGDTQGRLQLQGVSVDPHQLLGIEINPRAASIAEMVLWIGYLQWHYRTRGDVIPPLPVLKDFHNIECRDAVLAYDRAEYATDDRGVPVTRWNGRSFKKHPVTGEDVPDETARVPLERYVNPRKAVWPSADFVVGNPPFLGNKRMRFSLGDGYTEALRAAWGDVPESADFVMYWWHQAAQLTRSRRLRQFGLITTNSLRQPFNRRVVESHMEGEPSISLTFAIPDHPWVDSADGAAVRIAMSVGRIGQAEGQLAQVVDESTGPDGEAMVRLSVQRGRIYPDLHCGVDVHGTEGLLANQDLSFMGVTLVGEFRLTAAERDRFVAARPEAAQVIKPYVNGRDLSQVSQQRFVIDLFGWDEERVRNALPEIYQWLLERVKPDRDQNKRATYRSRWWIFGEPRANMRGALVGLRRYIATLETAKHRFFVFLDASVVPDHTLFAVASEDAFDLGILSSYVHVCWALAAGSRLGVGNDPRWRNVTCFEPFSFPVIAGGRIERIRSIAEALDQHRKQRKADHHDLTLTAMYNVLEKLRAGEALDSKEAAIHEAGLVSILKQLHDDLDRTVLEIYGWSDLVPAMDVLNGNAPPGAFGTPATRSECKQFLDDALLQRLVGLNAERIAEEVKGTVRWLRPEFQARKVSRPLQAEIEIEEVEEVAGAIKRRPWPRELPDQMRQVAEVLAATRVPLEEDAIAARFTGRGPWRKRLPQLVDTLVTLGRARRVRGGVVSVA